jgi:3-hydroxybutyryl-CoA dehydratase
MISGAAVMTFDPRPGAALPAIAKHIDQEQIDRWARLSGDFNRLHVDPEYAAGTKFGGTIAHGPLSLAFLNELMMACFDEEWAAGGRLLEVRFTAPIRPGDDIQIGGRVEAVTADGPDQRVECRLEITKADGTPAVTGRGVGRLRGRAR